MILLIDQLVKKHGSNERLHANDEKNNRADMQVMNGRLDVMKGEMRRKLDEALGRDMLAVQEEVKECMDGVQKEVKP